MKVDVRLYIYYWKRRVFIATSVDFAEESIGLIPGKPLSISEILMIIMIYIYNFIGCSYIFLQMDEA